MSPQQPTNQPPAGPRHATALYSLGTPAKTPEEQLKELKMANLARSVSHGINESSSEDKPFTFHVEINKSLIELDTLLAIEILNEGGDLDDATANRLRKNCVDAMENAAKNLKRKHPITLKDIAHSKNVAQKWRTQMGEYLQHGAQDVADAAATGRKYSPEFWMRGRDNVLYDLLTENEAEITAPRMSTAKKAGIVLAGLAVVAIATSPTWNHFLNGKDQKPVPTNSPEPENEPEAKTSDPEPKPEHPSVTQPPAPSKSAPSPTPQPPTAPAEAAKPAIIKYLPITINSAGAFVEKASITEWQGAGYVVTTKTGQDGKNTFILSKKINGVPTRFVVNPAEHKGKNITIKARQIDIPDSAPAPAPTPATENGFNEITVAISIESDGSLNETASRAQWVLAGYTVSMKSAGTVKRYILTNDYGNTFEFVPSAFSPGQKTAVAKKIY